jgi:hypothetical protein
MKTNITLCVEILGFIDNCTLSVGKSLNSLITAFVNGLDPNSNFNHLLPTLRACICTPNIYLLGEEFDKQNCSDAFGFASSRTGATVISFCEGGALSSFNAQSGSLNSLPAVQKLLTPSTRKDRSIEIALELPYSLAHQSSDISIFSTSGEIVLADATVEVPIFFLPIPYLKYLALQGFDRNDQ